MLTTELNRFLNSNKVQINILTVICTIYIVKGFRKFLSNKKA